MRGVQKNNPFMVRATVGGAAGCKSWAVQSVSVRLSSSRLRDYDFPLFITHNIMQCIENGTFPYSFSGNTNDLNIITFKLHDLVSNLEAVPFATIFGFETFHSVACARV